jgi:hypothetical protein
MHSQTSRWRRKVPNAYREVDVSRFVFDMTGASRFCARDLARNIARFSYARCPLVSRLSLALSTLALTRAGASACLPARVRCFGGSCFRGNRRCVTDFCQSDDRDQRDQIWISILVPRKSLSDNDLRHENASGTGDHSCARLRVCTRKFGPMVPVVVSPMITRTYGGPECSKAFGPSGPFIIRVLTPRFFQATSTLPSI